MLAEVVLAERDAACLPPGPPVIFEVNLAVCCGVK